MYNEKLKFEVPEIPNFVIWTDPDTFQVSQDERIGIKCVVEGTLYLTDTQKEYSAILWWYPKEFSEEIEEMGFEEYFRTPWKDWFIDVPGYEVLIEDGKMKVSKEKTIRTAIAIPESLHRRIKFEAAKQNRKIANLIVHILTKHFG